MKKFFTYISRQPKDKLLSGIYKPHGNDKLSMDSAIHYPVIALINGYVEKGEPVKIYAMYGIGNTEYKGNLEVLEDDIKAIKAHKDFDYEIVPVPVSEEETANEHLNTFVKITDLIEDDDEVYLCCTYGSKPMPVVEMMSLNFAYRVKDNVSIESIVYGKVNHTANPKTFDIYDITALFNMLQITDTLAEKKVKNPVGYVKHILDINE